MKTIMILTIVFCNNDKIINENISDNVNNTININNNNTNNKDIY